MAGYDLTTNTNNTSTPTVTPTVTTRTGASVMAYPPAGPVFSVPTWVWVVAAVVPAGFLILALYAGLKGRRGLK